MSSNSFPIWALRAAGATVGATAGLLGSIIIDDPHVTPAIKAKKLLRCLILGGTTGLGLEAMRQGGKVIMDNTKTGSAHSKYLLRSFLLKKAAEDTKEETPPAETSAANQSWFSGSTAGLPNHYLVGGGIGALGGVTLYHLLNEKKKRRASGYLGSALAGLGVGAAGAGLYRLSNGLSLFGGSPLPTKKEPPVKEDDILFNKKKLTNGKTVVTAKKPEDLTQEERAAVIDIEWNRIAAEMKAEGKTPQEIELYKQEYYKDQEGVGAWTPLKFNNLNHYNDVGRVLARENVKDEQDIVQHNKDLREGKLGKKFTNMVDVKDSREWQSTRNYRNNVQTKYNASMPSFTTGSEKAEIRADLAAASSDLRLFPKESPYRANQSAKETIINEKRQEWTAKYNDNTKVESMIKSLDNLIEQEEAVRVTNHKALKEQHNYNGTHYYWYGLNPWAYSNANFNTIQQTDVMAAMTRRNELLNSVTESICGY